MVGSGDDEHMALERGPHIQERHGELVGGGDVLGLTTCGYGTERAVVHGIKEVGRGGGDLAVAGGG